MSWSTSISCCWNSVRRNTSLRIRSSKTFGCRNRVQLGVWSGSWTSSTFESFAGTSSEVTIVGLSLTWNKALMVEAGILSKLPKNVETVDESTRHEFAELLLSLSSLANTQFPVSSSEILPFLVGILELAGSSVETKELCIGTLYNLSVVLDNAGPLVSNGVVQTLLKLSSIKEVHSESAINEQ
ncbi:hypothetical protein Q3G72_035288 [Acer saccharum]|nr:hypothetical protein Q3G72_035288 [Acer saccharum]